MLTPADLLLLEIGAETIDECFAQLAAPNVSYSTEVDCGRVRATAWSEALRDDASRVLLRRIRAEGWHPGSLITAVKQLPPFTNGHGWADMLNWAIAAVHSQSDEDDYIELTNNPFGHLLFPLCAAAGLRIKRTISRPAFASLQRGLLVRLCTYAAPSFYEEFAKFRENPSMVSSLQTESSDEIYRSFISAMRNGLFQEFLMARPPLARLMMTLIVQWVDATNEFLDRLADDEEAISKLTGSHCSIQNISAIQTNLSDPHNRGRGVLLLTFSSGTRIVYKPRSLAADSIWRELTGWLARNEPLLADHPPTLNMGQYGWQGYCEHAPCPEESASRFYKRLGASLALFRVLGSSDMHHENVVANGDKPVFVDLETLVAPVPRADFSVHPALHAVEQMLLQSVWRSGVLPDAIVLPTGDVMAYGALAASPSTSGSGWDFIQINTDHMRFVQVPRPKTQFSNLPESELKIFPPSAHVGDIKSGYARAVSAIRSRWLELEHPHGPLRDLSSIPIRAIFRPTAVYASLLNNLRNPTRQKTGISWSAQLELDQGDTRQIGVLGTASLLESERRALIQADIPYFQTMLGNTTVWDASHSSISDAVEKTQHPFIGRSLFNTKAIDRDFQLIEWSLADSKLVATTDWPDFSSSANPDEHLLFSEAENLFHLLRRRATIAGDGVAWWGRKSLLKAPNIGLLGPSLYDGTAGIAVFLAALTAFREVDGAMELTRRAMATLHTQVRAHRQSRLRPDRTLGIAFGMGGIAYALAIISRLLDEKRWLDDAGEAARWLTPEIIQKDRVFEIMDGSAGAIIALLAMAEATGEEQWIDTARVCGTHLIAAHQRGHLWWTTPNEPIQTGMAHGLAGIGFALCRLSKISRRTEFGELGLEALRLIDRSYDEGLRDWSSELLAEGSTQPGGNFWCRWCHGALGVGLAWHEQLEAAATNLEAASYVNRAKEGAVKNSTRPADTLCCGNFGIVDFLVEIADGNEQLQSLALTRATWLVKQRRRRGAYGFDGGDNEANLGLFPGVSGIGYVILRTLAPESLPSLLTFS